MDAYKDLREKLMRNNTFSFALKRFKNNGKYPQHLVVFKDTHCITSLFLIYVYSHFVPPPLSPPPFLGEYSIQCTLLSVYK